MRRLATRLLLLVLALAAVVFAMSLAMQLSGH
jgi:hypothetical protein